LRRRLLAVVPFVLLSAPFSSFAVEQLIPAGSLIQCTVSEPKLSSKTTDIGDPVLCHVSHAELYGRSVFPYGSYLVGRFEDYQDPGHFYGKGWMELKFERMVLPPDQVIPISAKVVYVPNYPVDKQGRIHGKGHTTRDIVEWCIPVLWPIDLLSLPRRGPRPVLKSETRLTLKVMDDLGVPMPEQGPNYSPSPYGFSQRQPMSSAPPPQSQYVPPAQPQYVPQTYAPATYSYAPPPPPVAMTVLVLRGGYRRMARQYWFETDSLRYVGPNGAPAAIPMAMLDVPMTVEVNRNRGVAFAMRASY
jgi:hypothetical protein